MNAINNCSIDNVKDQNENPTGGYVHGVGLRIDWQNGPLGRDPNRQEPNGAFVETVISAAKQRLEFFQDSKFMCPENAGAIMHLQAALDCLESRTKNRELAGTEGTHKV